MSKPESHADRCFSRRLRLFTTILQKSYDNQLTMTDNII